MDKYLSEQNMFRKQVVEKNEPIPFSLNRRGFHVIMQEQSSACISQLACSTLNDDASKTQLLT
jgi:hypothetical protein